MFERLKAKIARKRMKVEPVVGEDLTEYLSNFKCTVCHNHCKLSAIKCGGGLPSREEKTTEFNTKNS